MLKVVGRAWFRINMVVKDPRKLGILSKLNHALAQITLLGEECDCPGRIGSAYVAKHFGKDAAYVVELYKDAFDYYIFVEDEHCFVNNFDRKMIKTKQAVSSQTLAKQNWKL